MKYDLDKIQKDKRNRGLTFHWAIPVKVWIKAMEMRSNINHTCGLCKKEQKPLVGFTYNLEGFTGNKYGVGYLCDHLNCDDKKMCYNEAVFSAKRYTK